MNSSNYKIRFLLAVGDLFHINFAFIIPYILFFNTISFQNHYIFLLLIFNLSWLVVAYFLNIYSLNRLFKMEEVVKDLIKAISFHLLVLTAFLFLIKGSLFSRQHLTFTFMLILLLLPIWRVFALYLIKKYRELGFNNINIVIVGVNKTAFDLHNFFINDSANGYNLLAVFSDEKPKYQFDCNSHPISELENYCLENSISQVYFTLPYTNNNLMEKLLTFSDRKMIRFRIVPDYSTFKSRKIGFDFYGNLPVLTLREEPLQRNFNRITKRLFDLFFSSLVILFILSWLYPILFILIKLDSKGPVLFKQIRSGIDNKNFECYKFRSMKVNNSSDLKQAVKNDDRITTLGKFLRKTSLDEFPQFLNVFKGEMSVVGPRPHMIKHTDDYSKLIDNYMVRQLVKPGITGAAQANGFRGEIVKFEDIKNRVEYDVWYIENWSILLDVKLIFLTIINLIKGQENAR